MTASLPDDVRRVFDAFITTEYTTVDRRGQPITWPVTPYHHVEDGCVDVTTGLGYPKKASDAAANPRVALLFSNPTGSGLDAPPTVLVQGTAVVDDADLDANRRRYEREAFSKLPEPPKLPPEWVRRRWFQWYLARIYVHVRPERVYVWRGDDPAAEPELLDAHLEEVRSGHSEEPEAPLPPADAPARWDDRIAELGPGYPTAVLSWIAPDGFPFSVRVPVRADAEARVVRLGELPAGAPAPAGRVCLTAHAHDEKFTWQLNFQVRGAIEERDGGRVVIPHKVLGGIELPESKPALLRQNFAKVRRYHRVARRELARRG